MTIAFTLDPDGIPSFTPRERLPQNGQTSTGADTTTNYTTPYLMLVGAYNNDGGGVPGQPGFFLNGSIGEVLVYDSALTDSERQSVEGYLAKKWGTTASLPVGHPGLSL